MPVAPATIWRTNFSCPGTSTTPIVRPLGSSRRAKPSSMVTPRSFSSGSRSGSVPVSALTSADLPWSMCPAVPRTSEGMGARVQSARWLALKSVSRDNGR